MEISQENIDKLISLAERQTIYEKMGDEFNVYDASGGNFDDAYSMGVEDGEIDMARRVLYMMGIQY